MQDERRRSGSAERNQGPILEQLRQVMPKRGRVVELACGSGQHAVYFAPHFPDVQWQPSDIDPSALRSTQAWIDHKPCESLLDPIKLDVTRQPWPVLGVDLVLAINLIHITPWRVCEALMRGSAAALNSSGILCLYGPYVVPGVKTAPSNLRFDADLRGRNPDWGVRNLDQVSSVAQANHLILRKRHKMPANNYFLVFIRE